MNSQNGFAFVLLLLVPTIVLWIVFITHEAKAEVYRQITMDCTGNKIMDEECKAILADKKIYNYEYMIFDYIFKEKQPENGAVSTANTISAATLAKGGEK